jgi:para-nitrobenzyl esterase
VAEARAGRGTANTWAYRFDHPEPADNHRLGACHGAEIPFVFDTITLDEVRPRIGNTPSQAVADQVHGTWVRFITSGNPGWAAYDSSTRSTGLLADDLHEVDDPAADERVLWDRIR